MQALKTPSKYTMELIVGMLWVTVNLLKVRSLSAVSVHDCV